MDTKPRITRYLFGSEGQLKKLLFVLGIGAIVVFARIAHIHTLSLPPHHYLIVEMDY
jgi:ABC-type Fe3+ transport system permease subunit